MKRYQVEATLVSPLPGELRDSARKGFKKAAQLGCQSGQLFHEPGPVLLHLRVPSIALLKGILQLCRNLVPGPGKPKVFEE